VAGRAGLTWADAAVAAGFVLAAVGEAAALHRGAPGLLALTVAGAPLLAVLAVRRTRPLVPVCVVAGFVVLGTAAQAIFLPDAADSGGGVWLLALMLASYSLGAFGHGRTVAVGALLPMLAALAIDVPSLHGWALANGVLFLTLFGGVLPTAVGCVVRARRHRLAVLEEQRDLIRREQRAQCAAVVLSERLHATERLQPQLLDGLRELSEQAARSVDAAEIERAARRLLGRTREEVLALTAPVDVPDATMPPPLDQLRRLRAASQHWTVLGAGLIGAGLALESTRELTLATPAWVAVLGSVLLALPMAMMWWRPLTALTVAWCVAVAFSRMVAPLDGSLSGSAFALTAAFAVALLSGRRAAVVGLIVCWCGQIVGVGAADPFGEAILITACWLSGLAVNEVATLVEQSRANTALLAGQEATVRHRAVVEERLRLAREVHDQVGHSLTVIILQAGAARRIAATEPGRTPEVMSTIAAAARDGLLAVRDDDALPRAELRVLLQRTRAAGVDLTADIADLEDSAPLDPGTQTVVHRIVQEALTNALRHAPGADVHVVVRRRGAEINVTVRNGAPERAGCGVWSGRGLAGLRERVDGRGGTVRWGPRPDGGFEVRAALPVQRLEPVG
jgi:signal transduction histidine kinase